MSSITWNLPMLQRFEARYKQAVEEGADTFTFDDHEFVTSYAKYLIEYLNERLK